MKIAHEKQQCGVWWRLCPLFFVVNYVTICYAWSNKLEIRGQGVNIIENINESLFFVH